MEVQQESLTELEAERLLIARLLSHDFRSPLTQILGLVQLMQIDRDPDNGLQYLQKVQNSADSLDMYLINLRDYLRLERRLSDLTPVSFVPIQVKPLLQRWMKRYERNVQAKNIQLQFQLTEDRQWVSVPEMLDDICRHLIHNAMKFTPTGGRIIIGQLDPDELTIENDLDVDKLPGLENLKKAFYPAHSAGTAAEPGIGLGLYLADTLANAMGAKLNLGIEQGRFKAQLQIRA